MNREKLITDEYLEQQKQLHESPRGYGYSGYKHAAKVAFVLEIAGWTSVLDYGCGAGTFGHVLRDGYGFTGVLWEYDPAVEGLEEPPPYPVDLVVCTDVLEHIEPKKIDNVLHHMRLLCRRAAFMSISLTYANKQLVDGRNAHLNVHEYGWWLGKLITHRWRISDWEVYHDDTGPKNLYLWARPT